MAKIKCINNFHVPAALTVGKEYEVLGERDDMHGGAVVPRVQVKDDTGGVQWFRRAWFSSSDVNVQWVQAPDKVDNGKIKTAAVAVYTRLAGMQNALGADAVAPMDQGLAGSQPAEEEPSTNGPDTVNVTVPAFIYDALLEISWDGGRIPEAVKRCVRDLAVRRATRG